MKVLLIFPTLPLSQIQQPSGNTKWGRKETSLVPVSWRQDGNCGFYSCSNQHWGTARLGLMHQRELCGCSTPAPLTKPNSSTQLLALAEFLGSVLCFAGPWHQGSGEKQLFTDVRQLLGHTGSHLLQWVRRKNQRLLLPLLWHLRGCSDWSAWCSGWKLKVVLPVRQPKGNLWK